MNKHHSSRGIAMLSLLLLLAGCERSVGPAGSAPGAFDATAVSTSLATIHTASTGAAWQSLRALGTAAGLPGGAGARTVNGYGVAQALLAANGTGANAIRIPLPIRGLTFVYDTITGGYVPDPSIPGAPADGVRFIIYTQDSSGRPQPGAPIGHADLHDLGSPFSPPLSLRLEVVVREVNRLDYTVTAVGNDSTGQLLVSGYVREGGTRIDLAARAMGGTRQDTTAAQIEFTIGIPNQAFGASALLRHLAVGADSVGEIGMTVAHGGDRVALAGHVTVDSIAAAFEINGRPLATVLGERSHPIIRGAGGRELTPEEVQALVAIQALAGNVMELFGDLMRPVGAILGV